MLALGAGAVLGLSAWVAPVAGAEGFPPGSHFGEGGDHAVFVQTDNIAGNQIVAYHRDHDGTLTLANTYATGGLGRRAERLGGRPSGLAGLAGLRPDARPALRRERRQQHGVGLLGRRRPAQPAPGGGLGRHVPGQHRRPRRSGVRAQRRGRRKRVGLLGGRRQAPPRSGGRPGRWASPSPPTRHSSPTRRDRWRSRPTDRS